MWTHSNTLLVERTSLYHCCGVTCHYNPGCSRRLLWNHFMVTSSNRTIFCVTGPLWGESTGDWWIPLRKASDIRSFHVSLICAWTNGWVNNRDAGNLRHHCAHYDGTVILRMFSILKIRYNVEVINIWTRNNHYLPVLLMMSRLHISKALTWQKTTCFQFNRCQVAGCHMTHNCYPSLAFWQPDLHCAARSFLGLPPEFFLGQQNTSCGTFNYGRLCIRLHLTHWASDKMTVIPQMAFRIHFLVWKVA